MDPIKDNIIVEPIYEKQGTIITQRAVYWWKVLKVGSECKRAVVGEEVRLAKNPIKYNDIYFSKDNFILLAKCPTSTK